MYFRYKLYQSKTLIKHIIKQMQEKEISISNRDNYIRVENWSRECKKMRLEGWKLEVGAISEGTWGVGVRPWTTLLLLLLLGVGVGV